MAHLAGHVYVGEEVHLDGLVAVAFACLASSALHIEGETAWLITANLRLGKCHEEAADIGKHTRIGGGVAARSAADGTLVYVHHLVYVVDALNAIVRHRLFQATIEMLREDGLQSLVDECRLARSAHACYDDEFSQGELYVDALQIVSPGSLDDDALAVALASLFGYGDLHLAVEILGGDGVGLQHVGRRALEDYLASLAARLRTDVYNPVGGTHHVFVVFYHDDRVAQVAQFLETVDEPVVVALVQTDARLVEDIEHVDELAANLGGETDALALSTGERGRLAVEREIVETHVEEEVDA